MRLINALILLLGRDCVCPEILILRGIPEHLWIFAVLRDSYAKSLPLPEEFRAGHGHSCTIVPGSRTP